MRCVSRFGAAHSELQREGEDKNGSIKGLAMDKVGNKQNKKTKDDYGNEDSLHLVRSSLACSAFLVVPSKINKSTALVWQEVKFLIEKSSSVAMRRS